MTIHPSNQLSCEEVVLLLWDYLDSELDDDRRERVREHLAECDHCAGQFTFEGAFLRAVGGVIDHPLDTTALRRQIVRRLAEQGYGRGDHD
jgi:anti-sigma factor (TIGR02949 family)